MSTIFSGKTYDELMQMYFDTIIRPKLTEINMLDGDNISKLKSNMNTIETDVDDFKKKFEYSFDKFIKFRKIKIVDK